MVEKRANTAAVWIATGLGVGLVTPAPGTVAGLWGIPLTLAIWSLPSAPMQFAAIALVCVAGIPLCTRAGRDMGGVKDPGAIAFDEIAALPIVFLFLPEAMRSSGDLATVARTLAIGFVLFRFFDILKPPPTKTLERLPNGLGVMADDWMAGGYACAAFHALIWTWPALAQGV